MTIKSRTIDNLGVEASIRYAKDQELFEPAYIEESKIVAQKTEVSIASPSALSEFNQLFSLGKTLPWAVFSPPPDYLLFGRRLFSYQLIPSLGDYEKMEANSSQVEPASQEPEKKRKADLSPLQRPLEPETEKEERNRKALEALFQCINRLDKTLSLINARRNQYQRG